MARTGSGCPGHKLRLLAKIIFVMDHIHQGISSVSRPPRFSSPEVETTIRPDTSVATRVELIRPLSIRHQTDLLSQLTAVADGLRGQPGFVSLNVFAATDSPLIVTFEQRQTTDQLTAPYADSLVEGVLQQRSAWIEEREAGLYTVVGSTANYGSHLTFQLHEPFVTLLDVMEYSGRTRTQREGSFRFNLKNGEGYLSQPGCYGIGVLGNDDLTRAVTIGQWASVDAFLAAVRHTAPGPMKWVLSFIRTVPQLNRLLQIFGKFLKNRPEYHVYRLHYAVVGVR